MRKTFIITLALTAGLLGQVESKLLWDGYDWKKIDRICREYPEYALPLKRAYLSGLLDGKLYYYLQVWAGDPHMADSLFSDYFHRFSPDQLIRGTDQFYEDPHNLYLPVVSAMAITSLRAMGFPAEVVDTYIRASRDWINRMTWLTTENPTIKLEGISQPAAPRSPEEIQLPKASDQLRKWYTADTLILP